MLHNFKQRRIEKLLKEAKRLNDLGEKHLALGECTALSEMEQFKYLLAGAKLNVKGVKLAMKALRLSAKL